jgi:nucleotide-binding universal stress UspA family protein
VKSLENQIFSNILVLVDGSPFCIRAQELAALIAKKFSSKVTVLHVVAHELMHPQLQRFSPETPEIVTAGVRMQASPWVRVPEPGTSSIVKEVSNIYRQQGEDAIADASILFKEEGISVNQRLLEHADPGETAIKEAQKESCDLIVMGRSSGEGETKPHLGSMAAKVTAHSQIPVLVAADRSRISKILAPIDGSEASEKSVDYGGALAKRTNTEMTLLYVQESSLFGVRPEVTKKIGTDILSSAAQRVKGVRVDQKLESGDVANTIIQVADKGDYDLIVMGGRGHSAVRHFFLGGVSDHVLHYADRAILIVK